MNLALRHCETYAIGTNHLEPQDFPLITEETDIFSLLYRAFFCGHC